VQAVTETQADSVRADFLAYNQRERDARALLERVLHDDPDNTLAHETMGYLEFRARHEEEAQNWYQQAIKLGSQSYVANYYFGAIAMSREPPGSMDSEIESSLRKAIKLNPDFAPSYDSLAVFYGVRHKNLDEARMLSLQAVQLEPGNVHYRMTSANILLAMERYRDAVAVLQAAMKVAKTPEEASAAQAQLGMVQQALAEREAREESSRAEEGDADDVESAAQVRTEPDIGPPVLKERLKGPHRFVTGTLKNVRCSMPAVMDMTMDAGEGKIIPLHSSNYFNIQFTARGFVPSAELKPCGDLEGTRARVEYIESVSNTNGVVSIEMRK
jgi:Tfp pilus assembly protein PilF